MSESILNALMHLFAIIANVAEDEVSIRGRTIVKAYIKQHLNKGQVNEYLKLFDNYLSFYQRELRESKNNNVPEKDSLMSFQISNICHQINKGLHQNEKIIVFLRLLEFEYEDEIITDKEFEFIKIVAKTFNISKSEFNNTKAFIFDSHTENIEKDKILIIEDKEIIPPDELEGSWIEQHRPVSLSESKHIYNENLAGRIIFLHIVSINTFVFRYFGKGELYIGGHYIFPNRFYILEHGSIIKGPKINPIYYSDVAGKFLQSPTKPKIVITGNDIEFRFKNSENGIQKFNFSEESGQLIGIMGGSGVGKSTLLNVLNGKLFLNSGEILINGYDIQKNKFRLEGIIGYVPQDDLLIEELTVYQNLYYNAKLCFSNFSEYEIRQTVEKILIDLDLEDIKNLKVGNPLNKFISGGQRKRLNIGLELMREPYILFVDEPTTGLSSMGSEKVMLLLKEQTVKGKLVIANIHQPSSNIFKLLDKLWIFDKGGYPIYNGNPIDAIVYFKTMSSHVNATESECPSCANVNPEQILQIVESKVVDELGKFTNERKNSPKEWYNLYKENIETKLVKKETKKILPKIFFKISDLGKQFEIFSIRNLLSKLTNKQFLLINFLEAPLLAFILAFFTKYIRADSYIFSENKNLAAYLFMSVVVALFIGLTVSAEEIIKDRKILERESFLNLSRFSYLNSKILFLFVLSAIQTISFVLIGNLILEIKGMTLSYWLILFTTSCFANMTGLIISSGFNSVVTIYILIPFILVPQLLLSGTIVKFDDLHKSLTSKIYVPPVGDLMASRWAYEALVVEQYKNNKFEKIFFGYEQQISETSFKTNFLIPRLISKIEECERNFITGENQQKTETNLNIIKNEINQLKIAAGKPVLDFIEIINQLTTNSFNTEIAEETKEYLEYLNLYFFEKFQEASSKKDEEYNKLISTLGSEKVYQLMHDYVNNSLADLVTNRKEIYKIYETDKRLIQKADPVFMYPESNFGRSHFYAPAKKFNGKYIDTLMFNLMVIWLMTFFLYILLLVDGLRIIVTYFENIKFRKAS